MKFCPTLSKYFISIYLKNLFFISFILLGIVYMFDVIELIRKSSKFDNVPISLVMQMGLLKLIDIGQVISPFIILFSAMFTFWQLNKRSELVIVKSVGFSVWQFLSPIIAVTMFIGIIQITIINPIGTILLSKYEHLEKNYLQRQPSSIVTIFKDGLWLLQEMENKQGYAIIRSKDIKIPEWELRNVTVIFFNNEDVLQKRIDAKSASIKNNSWIFKNVIIHQANNSDIKNLKEYKLPTSITAKEIEDSFSDTETMSFWKLNSYIKTVESTGFDAVKLKIHFQSLLSVPFLFCAMILLAACVSMRPPRQKENTILILSGIFIGFTIFFTSSYLQALGASHQIPVFMAAWTPSIIGILTGISILLSIEDG